MYTSRLEHTPVGRVRYGVMCTEEGIIFDDGVVARLDDDHFYLTTTTGGINSVFEWLTWWLAGWALDAHVTNVTGSYAAVNLAGPHARDALAQLLLGEGDLPGALAELARLAHAGGLVAAMPHFQQTLDDTVRAAARSELECPRVVERLGGRRGLFVRLAGEPGPFLRVGDCFLELGMPEQALEVYRGVVRRFGTYPGTDLPLRVARASLAAGDLAVLRATLRAHFALRATAEGPVQAQWLWLRSQLDLREGRTEAVADQLVALAGDATLEPGLRVAVEQALVALPSEAIAGDRLGRTLAASLARPTPGVPAERRAEAWLRLADVQRARGRPGVARPAYLRAVALLPEGPRRNRARFAAALLAPTPERLRAALAEFADAGSSEPWSRLARSEGRLIQLRAAVRGEVIP